MRRAGSSSARRFAARVGVLTEALGDLGTEMTDVVERIWGDTGVVIEDDH